MGPVGGGRDLDGAVPVKRLMLTLAALVVVVAVGVMRPDRAARVAAGLTAHTICSAAHVSGVDPLMVKRELVDPLTSPASRVLSYRVDPRGADAWFAGIVHQRATFVPGYGCRLELAGDRPPPAEVAPRLSSDADDLAPIANVDPALDRAVARAFAERPGQPRRNVKAIVVMHDGHVVAERYAPGYGVGTPLLSYSVAKSLTNAIVGVLVREGRLRVDQTAAAREWHDDGDQRARITVEDLMRMTSGLDAEERGSPTDPVSLMEFTTSDMATFAARRPLKNAPGSTLEYTSANTLILARLVGGIVGNGPADLRGFAERELFHPLGMSNVTMEFDGAGTFVGSSYLFAPARSYARFGELYRRDGLAPDGRRILPEGWTQWSHRATLGDGYGAGFFTNDGNGDFARARIKAGFPSDGFYASGVFGQRVYIIPSAGLVIARFGFSPPPDFGMDEDLALIRSVIALTRPTGVPEKTKTGQVSPAGVGSADTRRVPAGR